MDGYRRARAFLVTERPGPGAPCDGFWRLVWEQGVVTVVIIGSYQVGAGESSKFIACCDRGSDANLFN